MRLFDRQQGFLNLQCLGFRHSQKKTKIALFGGIVMRDLRSYLRGDGIDASLTVSDWPCFGAVIVIRGPKSLNQINMAIHRPLTMVTPLPSSFLGLL